MQSTSRHVKKTPILADRTSISCFASTAFRGPVRYCPLRHGPLLMVSVVWSLLVCHFAWASESVDSRSPIVEVEEEVYTVEPANNGAGPMWCFGNTCVVRSGEYVFASGLHTLETAKPLNNCVPSVFRRDQEGWKSVYRSMERTREPCPLATFPGGSVFLSVNPTTTPPDTYSGPSLPGILEFPATSPSDAPRLITPKWDGTPQFSEHSYRSFVVDGKNGEMILFQNVGYTHAEWSFRDRDGEWSAHGKLPWPRDDTSEGTLIRVCYPAVALVDRRVFVCGVSDIVEPNREWLDYKRELTGREWDYVFRRLYFTWSDDITTGTFHDWVEISNRESTAGSIFPNDLFVNSNGDVSLLWSETALDERLRDRFFPMAKQRHALEYAVVRQGKVANRVSVVDHAAGVGGQIPGRGRFHATPDGRLWVFYYLSGVDDQGNPLARNQLIEVGTDATLNAPLQVNLQHPLSSFFTNSVRAGCLPANTLDVFGQIGNTMRYARIRLP